MQKKSKRRETNYTLEGELICPAQTHFQPQSPSLPPSLYPKYFSFLLSFSIWLILTTFSSSYLHKCASPPPPKPRHGCVLYRYKKELVSLYPLSDFKSFVYGGLVKCMQEPWRIKQCIWKLASHQFSSSIYLASYNVMPRVWQPQSKKSQYIWSQVSKGIRQWPINWCTSPNNDT